MENLVLHIKIFEFPNPKSNESETVGVGSIYNFIVPELKDIYSGIECKMPWKQMVIKVVLPLKNDYFKCIKKLVELDFPQPPLLTNFIFNESSYNWSGENNKNLYKELKNLDVKF